MFFWYAALNCTDNEGLKSHSYYLTTALPAITGTLVTLSNSGSLYINYVIYIGDHINQFIYIIYEDPKD